VWSCCVLLVVPDPMKVGDWVTWNGGSNIGKVIRVGEEIVQVEVTTYPPNRLSATIFTLPYPPKQLTVIPEVIAKIINS
jgi:hypothetical protein